MGMRIAVDVNISNRDIGDLARYGHAIVCVAGHGEEDWRWLERALERDVDVVISQDLDIPNLLDQWNVAQDVIWFESLEDFKQWREKYETGKAKCERNSPAADE